MDVNKTVKRIIAIIIALSVWQLAAMIINERILIASPVEVALRLTVIWREKGFIDSVLFTFEHITMGFLIGLVIGTVLAVLAYMVPGFEDLLWPWMATVKAVPVASFVVICLIWLTAANLSVFISFLVVLPIVYNNILTGLKQQNVQLNEMADVFHMPVFKRIRYVVIPQLSPYIISACRTAVGLSWKAGVAAEIIGTPNGSMGRMLYLSKIYLDTAGCLSWTVIIVVLSIISEKIFIFALERILNAGKAV
ncbi:MAG: ABC transporter permease [Lachnospira sp.]